MAKANGILLGALDIDRLPHALQVAAAKAHTKFTGGEPHSPNYIHVEHLEDEDGEQLDAWLESQGIEPLDVDLILF